VFWLVELHIYACTSVLSIGLVEKFGRGLKSTHMATLWLASALLKAVSKGTMVSVIEYEERPFVTSIMED
jgi:hypothetical protein